MVIKKRDVEFIKFYIPFFYTQVCKRSCQWKAYCILFGTGISRGTTITGR